MTNTLIDVELTYRSGNLRELAAFLQQITRFCPPILELFTWPV